MAAYRIGATGALTRIGVVDSACVNALAVDPTGRFVYVEDSNRVSVFSIGPTGALTEVGSSENLSSISVAVDPTGRFVYVPGCADTACNGGNVASFQIGSSGALTPLATRPATGSLPVSIATTSCTAPLPTLPTLPTSLPPVVTKTDLHLPFSTSTFVNSVRPEFVTLTGLIHTTTTVTRFGICPAVRVGAHAQLHGVSGVGPVSGITYHAHGTVRAQGTLVTPGTFSFPATFRITAPHSIIPSIPVVPIRTSVAIDSQGVATQAQTTLPSDVLWLCHDGNVPLRQVDTGGTILSNLTTTACSGVAFDGTFLYVSNFTGDISKRTADGITVLASSSVAHDPGVCCAEDLAFDTKRGKIWRIDHSHPAELGLGIPSKLRRIDPGTLTQEAVFDLPLSVSGFGTDLGGMGLAYDPFRDLLYASFCHAGCSSFGSGIVLKIDPNTGTDLGTLFTSSVFATFGLGYDFKTDTLWMSSFDPTLDFVVRHMTLAGAVLSTFSSGLVGDGLEFISGGSIP